MKEGILGFILNMRAQVDNVAIDFVPSIGVTQDSISLAIKSLYILILCKNTILYFHTHPFRIVSSSTGYFLLFHFLYKKKGGTRRKEKEIYYYYISCTNLYIYMKR